MSFFGPSTELVILEKSLVSSDYFRDIDPQTKIFLGRQVILRVFQYREPPIQDEHFLKSISNDTRTTVNKTKSKKY